MLNLFWSFPRKGIQGLILNTRQFLKSYLIILNYIWCSCNTLERPEGTVGVLQVFLPSHVLFPSALFRPFFKLQSSKLYILLWPIPLGSRNAFRRGYIYIAARTVWNAMCIGSPRGCGRGLWGTKPLTNPYMIASIYQVLQVLFILDRIWDWAIIFFCPG